MKLKYLFTCITVALGLAFSLVACGGAECDPHNDKNDDGKCDVCEEAFTDGCHTKVCLDTDSDGKCDNEGCDKATENKPSPTCTAHTDANDNGACDVCAAVYRDGCNAEHKDADDDGKCDIGTEQFTDGCDTVACLDTDSDGKCDNEGCDKATSNKPAAPCEHKDVDDNGKCDVCQAAFTDGCDNHIDNNDDYICDTEGCDVVLDDGMSDGAYRVVYNYLPEEISTVMYEEFEDKAGVFVRMYQSYAPFAYFDHINLSNCRVLSITIPILISKDADENGDFVFTLHEINNTFDGLSMQPVKSYKIKLNKDTYGITPGDHAVYKLVTIDLKPFNIELTDKETLAFGASTDTLIPAYLHADEKNEFASSRAFDNYFEQGIGVFKQIGKGFKVDSATLCFDLTIEKRYESEAAYNKMLADDAKYEEEFQDVIEQLKEIYKGKNVSVLGDSISTFQGLSNNGDMNSTLSSHGTGYYPSYDNSVGDYTETYWGALIKDLDMNLCVDNAWSGTHVYGSGKRNYKDSAPARATELHRNNGMKPDLIVFYMGVNDMDSHRKSSGQAPFGSLYNKLIVNDGKTDQQKVAEWWADVLKKYQDNGSIVEYGTTYKDFEQAYALALYLMKQKYEGVEIICVNLLRNRYEGITEAVTAKFNRVITAIGTYFGATVVEQMGPLAELTFDNSFLYSANIDDVAVHPNVTGHKMMERLIIKTLAQKHGIALPEKN